MISASHVLLYGPLHHTAAALDRCLRLDSNHSSASVAPHLLLGTPCRVSAPAAGAHMESAGCIACGGNGLASRVSCTPGGCRVRASGVNTVERASAKSWTDSSAPCSQQVCPGINRVSLVTILPSHVQHVLFALPQAVTCNFSTHTAAGSCQVLLHRGGGVLAGVPHLVLQVLL